MINEHFKAFNEIPGIKLGFLDKFLFTSKVLETEVDKLYFSRI